MSVTATQALFIKLGSGGEWEDECIKRSVLRIGFRKIPHELCLAGDWRSVREKFLEDGCTKGTAQMHTTELERFYTADKFTLWITFSNNRLYWGFVGGPVKTTREGYKERVVIRGWRNEDINGAPLHSSQLSSKLTQVSGYRGTICNVTEFCYLKDRLNGTLPPEVQVAQRARGALLVTLEPLIQNLTWRDFETLVDMVFTAGGWRRIGVLGKNEKDIDLDLQQPVTRERLFVQVKSKCDTATLRKISTSIRSKPEYHRAFAVTHSFTGKLPNGLDPRLKLVQVSELSPLVLDAGLTDWLLEKSK
ncbi:MAG: restriction endonuclease [Nibricoccus sp.]